MMDEQLKNKAQAPQKEIAESSKEIARSNNEIEMIANCLARQKEDSIQLDIEGIRLLSKIAELLENHDKREGGKVAKVTKTVGMILHGMTAAFAVLAIMVAVAAFEPEDWPVIQERLYMLVERVV